jgi:hypothetical protein
MLVEYVMINTELIMFYRWAFIDVHEYDEVVFIAVWFIISRRQFIWLFDSFITNHHLNVNLICCWSSFIICSRFKKNLSIFYFEVL